MRAPIDGRSAAGSLPSPLSSSVSAPALPRYFAFACSSCAASSTTAKDASACSTMVSSFSIGTQEKKGRRRLPFYRRFRLDAEGGLRFFNEFDERGLVEHRDVRKHLAVHLDLGLPEPVHEHAVGKPVLAGSSIDAGDPQAAKVALLVAAVAIGILPGAHDRLVGD